MEIRHLNQLSQSEQNSIQHLIQLCRQAEKISLSFPEDGDDYWLLTGTDGELLSCLAAFQMGEGLWECCAFTRPDKRKQGCFSRLLEQACSTVLQECDLYFGVDEFCTDAREVLQHLGAEPGFCEYMMERELGQAVSFTEQSIQAACQWKGSQADVTFWMPGLGTVGSCQLSACQKSIYLYGLKVTKKLRGRGLGTKIMEKLISDLEKDGYHLLRLQVSGENEAALALYKKTGFRIAETLYYFLY